MRVFKGLGDEVRPDDLFPRRGPKDVGAAIGDGFVHDIPDFDLALVTTDDGHDMVVHPLKQLFPGRARSAAAATAKSAETAAETAPSASSLLAGLPICRRGRIACSEHPRGRLAVPDQGVAD